MFVLPIILLVAGTFAAEDLDSCTSLTVGSVTPYRVRLHVIHIPGGVDQILVDPKVCPNKIVGTKTVACVEDPNDLPVLLPVDYRKDAVRIITKALTKVDMWVYCDTPPYSSAKAQKPIMRKQ